MCKKNSKLPNFSAVVSILGIAFGVLSFLIVVTVLDAFQTQMKSIISSVNPNLTIFSPMGITNSKNIEKKIVSLLGNQIDKINPFIYQESIIAYKKQTSAVYIRAIPGTESSSAQNLSSFISPQNALSILNNPSTIPRIIIGKELASTLGATIGSNVTLMTFETNADNPPRTRYIKMIVSGILNIGLAQYDKQYILMNFQDGVRLFGTADWASGFEVQLKHPDNALQIATKYSQELPYSIIAWQEIDAGLFQQIARDSAVIKFIVFIISVVGAFNILVTLGLTVIDRSKQISLLRSLGAQKRNIIGIFIGIGGILGFLGAVLGTILAIALLLALSKIPLGDLNQFYYLDKIPVEFNPSLIVFVFIAAILLSCLGALYPAWKASKVLPIIGLK